MQTHGMPLTLNYAHMVHLCYYHSHDSITEHFPCINKKIFKYTQEYIKNTNKLIWKLKQKLQSYSPIAQHSNQTTNENKHKFWILEQLASFIITLGTRINSAYCICGGII